MFAYFINIPTNEKGIHELESFDPDMANVRSFELYEEDYLFLINKNGLFSTFNDKLGTLIDECEEEIINMDQINEAIDITNLFIKKTDIPYEKSLYNKILRSLEIAKSSNTFWEIDIFLR